MAQDSKGLISTVVNVRSMIPLVFLGLIVAPISSSVSLGLVVSPSLLSVFLGLIIVMVYPPFGVRWVVEVRTLGR